MEVEKDGCRTYITYLRRMTTADLEAIRPSRISINRKPDNPRYPKPLHKRQYVLATKHKKGGNVEFHYFLIPFYLDEIREWCVANNVRCLES